jgi:hypothetical protein
VSTPGILLAVLTVFAAGAGLTLALWPRSSPIFAAEFFGLAWLLGAGVVSTLLALGGIVLSGGALFASVAASTLLLGMLAVKRLRDGVRIETGLGHAPTWEKWLSVLALAPIFYMAWIAFRDAIIWDGLLIWESKARHAFLAGGSLPAAYFSDATRVRFHPSYPLYLPFTELWVYLWVGDCDQTAVKMLFPIFFAAAMALLWSGTLRLGGRLWAAALTTLLPLFVPLMADHGHGVLQGYADFLLGAVYLAGVTALLAWHFRGVEGGWPVAMACAAMLPWIKQEGLLLFGSLILQAALAVGWRGWRRILLFALPGMVTVIAWRFGMQAVHVVEETTFQAPTFENLLQGLPRLWPIFYAMGFQFSQLANWSLLWFCVPFALLSLAFHRRREALALALALLVPLLLDVIPFLLSRLDLYFHISTSLDRLILQLAPVAVLCLGLALAGKSPSPATKD